MNLSILTGIEDNDPKGKTGVGTVYWTEVSVNGEVKERVTYGLLDLIQKRFDFDAFVKPFKDEFAKFQKEQADKEAAAKKAEREARTASVKADDLLEKLIAEVIATETKAVAEYKGGKEKALNAMTGKVIGQMKKAGREPDAFAITTLLKQKLA